MHTGRNKKTEKRVYLLLNQNGYVNGEYIMHPYFIEVTKNDILPFYETKEAAAVALEVLTQKGTDASEIDICDMSFGEYIRLCHRCQYIPDYAD